jgi:hypothetical protein
MGRTDDRGCVVNFVETTADNGLWEQHKEGGEAGTRW